ncbi:MAG: rhomboid family intramembrane serine protease [Actinobacteria bacterium]|nr:rhomboid family intramembrane serine protease [Actinomycetota bacterium]
MASCAALRVGRRPRLTSSESSRRRVSGPPRSDGWDRAIRRARGRPHRPVRGRLPGRRPPTPGAGSPTAYHSWDHYRSRQRRGVALLPIRDINPTRARPVLTWGLIAACVIVYFAVQPAAGSNEEVEFLYRQAAIACELTTGSPLDRGEILEQVCRDEPGRPVFPEKNVWLAVGVSMFLHGGILHLLFNMWSLWIFGNNVEEAFGPLFYLLLYAASGVAATAGFVWANPQTTVPLVGASGAIAGIMGAYLVLFPRHLVLTLILFRIVAIPAVFFLGLWFLSQFLLVGESNGIAWEAHVAGFLFGMLVTLPFRRRLLSNALAPEAPARAARTT